MYLLERMRNFRSVYFWTLIFGAITVFAAITFLSKSSVVEVQQPKEKSTLSINLIPVVRDFPYIKNGNDLSTFDSFVNFPFPLSKDLVLFNAFMDSRMHGSFTNTTMIFFGASKMVVKEDMVFGCGVGKIIARHFTVRFVYEDHLMHDWLGEDKFPYEQLVVECYDVPVASGDKAFLLYRTSSGLSVIFYTAEEVVVPAPRVTPRGSHDFSVVVCTKAHTKAVTWMPEFLKYQKTLGVDHVHLSVLDKYVMDEGLRNQLSNDSFFVKQVKENFISVQLWDEWFEEDEWYVHGTIMMYLDCLYRYRGTYDYVSFMDSDDFFTVRVPGMSYKDMIAKYCTAASTGSCIFKWLWYYPGICGMKSKVSEDGNVTAVIVPHHPEEVQKNMKSIHLSAAIVDSSFHDAKCNACLKSGYEIVHVPPEVAYVAHQRFYSQALSSNPCHL